MKNFKAIVTLASGKKIEVEYPAESADPNTAAIKAAAKAEGVKGFSQEPRVEHNRDESPNEE